MDWGPHAAALAAATVHPASRWHAPIASVPRHVFTPRWWRNLPEAGGWTLRDGAADIDRWMSAAYSDRTLVTRVGGRHADLAEDGDHPEGMPTSSSTLPGLVVAMYQHAMLAEDLDVLCVTGTGYGTALLARRFGDHRVTSIDVDAYGVDAARHRLGAIGLRPQLAVCDITGPLPGRYDRIAATVSVQGIPASWLTALRPGGRLVATLAGTGLVITADMRPDGGARGVVAQTRAGFMAARAGDDYPPPPDTRHAWTEDGDEVRTALYPVVQVAEAWELSSMLALTAPGTRHEWHETADGMRTAVMTHPDGSWARATGHRGHRPTVHQAGPRRLWDTLDDIRHAWLSDGGLPVYGARVAIDPDGTLHLSRGAWRTTVPAVLPTAAVSV